MRLIDLSVVVCVCVCVHKLAEIMHCHERLLVQFCSNSILFYSTPCPEKNIPDIFDCNLEKNYQISIIFDTNISDTTGRQMTVQFSTAPIVCF